MYTVHISSFIFTVGVIFLPTAIIMLLTYPYYSKLDLEQKRIWIKDWGSKRIPVGLGLILCLAYINSSIYFLDFHYSALRLYTIICFLIVAMMFLVYFNWIKMITPPAEDKKDL